MYVLNQWMFENGQCHRKGGVMINRINKNIEFMRPNGFLFGAC